MHIEKHTFLSALFCRRGGGRYPTLERGCVRHRGFTLIEVMITIVIVAILSVIGYPIYTHYVRNSRRTAAVTALQRAAVSEEKYYAIHNIYAASLTALGYGSNAVPIPSATQDWYVLSASLNVVSGGYVLKAKPTGLQAQDLCGTYQLTSTGATSVLGTQPVSKCWGGG